MAQFITLVLAGGRSRRFPEGKLGVRVDGVPLAAWVADRVRGWSGRACEAQWLSVAPGSGRVLPPGAERFERWVADRFAFGGPLHAIEGALSQLRADDRLAVVAADMPAIARQDVAMLAQTSASSVEPRDAKVVMGRSKPSRVQPLPSIWRGDALGMVRQAIANGHHALHRLALLHGDVACVAIPPEAGERWVNMNRVEDVVAMEAALGVAIACPSSKGYPCR
jgi:molybdopterin-guanine dinucleotide biosynthesis protein A